MPKLIVEIPEHTHRALKRRALEEDRTLRSVVSELIEGYLEMSPTPAQSRATGLCGSWRDNREADEIVAEVRAARRWRTSEVIGRD